MKIIREDIKRRAGMNLELEKKHYFRALFSLMFDPDSGCQSVGRLLQLLQQLQLSPIASKVQFRLWLSVHSANVPFQCWSF